MKKDRVPPVDAEYRAPSLRIGVRDAKAGLSGLLREVRGGREVIITEYGKPVARLVPAKALSLSDWVAEMESRGDLARQKPADKKMIPLSIPEGLAQKHLQEDREAEEK